MNPNEMTAQECADWCAKDDGWRQAFRHRHASGVEQWWWERDGGDESFDHPYPLTLDGAAKALPEGWKIWDMEYRGDGCVVAAILGKHEREIYTDGPDELTARYRLAVLCRLAMKEQA